MARPAARRPVCAGPGRPWIRERSSQYGIALFERFAHTSDVRKIIVAAAGVAALAIAPAALLTSSAHATTRPAAKVPPVCVRIPLPNPYIPGAQIQVGYCP
jgi:hypothetical protein